MALVRAIRLGVAAHGGKVKPGEVFEHAGPLASWMELAEGGDPSPAPSKTEVEAAPEPQSEAAGEKPAEDKRKLRNRKPAEGAE
jgi:hypothetical protein